MNDSRRADDAIGRVVAILRYPVKSMAGESLSAAEIDWQGMEGDRQYGFVRRGNPSRFPWLTGRDLPNLLLHRASYADAAVPRISPVLVTDDTGGEWDLRDPALTQALERSAGIGLDLLQLGIGAYDAMPLSIVTTASLAQVDARHGHALDRRRFRANIVVESTASDRDWSGRKIRLGGVELLAACLAPRCAMITIDPANAARNPAVMRTVAQAFDGTFAMYASVARPGVLRLGDAVALLD